MSFRPRDEGPADESSVPPLESGMDSTAAQTMVRPSARR